MLDKLAVLSGYDYFYAAVLAFLITYLLMRVRNFRNNVLKKDELEKVNNYLKNNQLNFINSVK